MKISSYNITDVAYHYIGLRVLGSRASWGRADAESQISRGVQKYAMDRALRLMLAEPRGTFATVGEKVLSEFRHFDFITVGRATVHLSPAGRGALELLVKKQFTELRRLMVRMHLSTYSNLRSIVVAHLDGRRLNRPIMDGFGGITVQRLIPVVEACVSSPMTAAEVERIASALANESPKDIEDSITQLALRTAIPGEELSVPLFRSMVDRLASMRLINQCRVERNGATVLSSYSTSRTAPPERPWYALLEYDVESTIHRLYMCEFDVLQNAAREAFLTSLQRAFQLVPKQGGYHDLPDLRDVVCSDLVIPEAAFDEAINRLLDESEPPISPGLRYEGISARRRPLLRIGDGHQIYNLLRPT